MTSEARHKFESISEYPFFHSCGQKLPRVVTAVKDLKTAIEECSSRKWENCRLMARNALQRAVEDRAWARIQEWDPIAEELRPLIVAFVDRLIHESPIPETFTTKIKDKLSWDFMGLCLEHQFRDVVEPIFYIRYLDPWYAAGHLPCGWDGKEFPAGWDGVVRQGRLMVY